MITVREGVELEDVSPEIVLAMVIARTLFFGMEVTSVRDGVHMEGSLHYVGRAFDFVHPMMSRASALRLRGHLGPQYDVIFEEDHIHVEFDPR